MNKDNIEVIKPPVLFAQTQRIIKEIEQFSGIKLLCYWNSVNGSICQNDLSIFYEIIKDWECLDELYLYVKSDGGNGKASLRIINLLREYTKKLIVLVHGECTSAATILALGADEIYMGPLSFLSAVDTSLTHDLSPVDKNNSLVQVSQDELTRVLTLWSNTKDTANPYPTLYQHIHPLVFGAVDRASSLSIKLCTDILSYHMKDKQKANEISKKLNSDYPSHNYPILLKEAKEMGLNVFPMDKNLYDMLFKINSYYSQMGKMALTDYDENNYHNNEIINILEANGTQIYYQVDKDWHYRNDERRYIPMNDTSSWYRLFGDEDNFESIQFQIR